MAIGHTLNVLIEESNYNINELASLVNVNPQTLYSIIKRDNMKADLDLLLKICEVLNVDINVFYKDYKYAKEDINMDFGDKLKECRKAKGLTQLELAQKLNVSKSTLAMYETNKREPNVNTIKALSNILSVSTNYLIGVDDYDKNFINNQQTQLHLEKYKNLDVYGKKAIDTLIDIELERIKHTTEPEEDLEPKTIHLYDLPASAGTGSWLGDDDNYSIITVPKTPTSLRATMCIRVSGDSMLPDYQDGDIVFVTDDVQTEPGDIGIFNVNGDSYIKKLGANELISLNLEYANISITEDTSIKCYGKVVGKL